MISSIDFVAVPSQDPERARTFYVETLGLRPDSKGRFEFWAGETCFGIWEPEKLGLGFAPQKNAHLALHVDDVAAAKAELEEKGVSFFGEILDTGVCHMAFFNDPDGNDLMLHNRYAPRDD
ncbi:MAG: VOC family protein [Solirubrobacterales bacterium]|nr:VOC family protein [Solirubrobacterales bacterium]